VNKIKKIRKKMMMKNKTIKMTNKKTILMRIRIRISKINKARKIKSKNRVKMSKKRRKKLRLCPNLHQSKQNSSNLLVFSLKFPVLV